jgi:hypothetical protein
LFEGNDLLGRAGVRAEAGGAVVAVMRVGDAGAEAAAGAARVGTASCSAFAALALLAAEDLRMILRTVCPPFSTPIFFGLGKDPRGAIFSRTPCRMRPASSKLVLF